MATEHFHDDEDAETQEVFLRELTELEQRVASIWADFDDARYKLNENQKRISQCGSHWKDVNAKLTHLKDMFNNDLSSLNKLNRKKSQESESNAENNNGHQEQENKQGSETRETRTDILHNEEFNKAEVETRLFILNNDVNELKTTKQRVGSLFLRFLVGRVSMRVWTDNERELLKEEYHKFKFRTNFIFLLFPILQLIWRHLFGQFSWVLHQWHHLWLLYYYLSLGMSYSFLFFFCFLVFFFSFG